MFKRSICTIALVGLISGSVKSTQPVQLTNPNDEVKYYLERAQDKLKQVEIAAQQAEIVETPMQQHVNKLKKTIVDKHVLNQMALAAAGIVASAALVLRSVI